MKMRTAIGCFAALSLMSIGCEPSVDRGQSKQPPIAPAGTPPQSSFDTVPEGGSKSAFGKARDQAVRLREKMQARDAEIGKMADEIFNPNPNPPPALTPGPKTPSRPVSVPAPNF